MDGFVRNKKFLCKELGILNLELNACELYRFRLETHWDKFVEKEAESAQYCTRRIHGLQFRDYLFAFPRYWVKKIFKSTVFECNKDQVYIAYKGSVHERNILCEYKCKFVILRM